MVRWLAARVGASGEVVAADIDISFLTELPAAHVRVLQHDIVRGAVGGDAFDLVHARFLLEWLPDWQTAPEHLLASTKPGGTLVLSDFVWETLEPAPAPLDALLAAFPVVTRRGWDPNCGRELPTRLEARGVHEVRAEMRAARVAGGSLVADWPRLSVEPFRRAPSGCRP